MLETHIMNRKQLQRTKLPTLAYRRLCGDLIEVFKQIKQYEKHAITSPFSTSARNMIRQTAHKSPPRSTLGSSTTGCKSSGMVCLLTAAIPTSSIRRKLKCCSPVPVSLQRSVSKEATRRWLQSR